MAGRPQRDIDAGPQIGISGLKRGHIRIAVEGKALADREADRLTVERLVRTVAAACSALLARSGFHDDRIARGIEDARRRGDRFRLLEGDHIGVERFGDAPHRAIVIRRTRFTAGPVALGEKLEVPARNRERRWCVPTCWLPRYGGIAGAGGECGEQGESREALHGHARVSAGAPLRRQALAKWAGTSGSRRMDWSRPWA
jgi:hypothetical protein